MQRDDRAPTPEEILARLPADWASSESLRRCQRFARNGNFRELPSDVDGHDLARTGWGVIYAEKDARIVTQGLDRLLKHRQQEAGSLYKAVAYLPFQTTSRFLLNHSETPGTIDPAKLPYYLLIVGSPVDIPFDLQYQLSINHAVGRLDFDDRTDLEKYADSVLAVERGERSVTPHAALLEVDNQDQGSACLKNRLVPALRKSLRDAAGESGWVLERLQGEDASKAALTQRLIKPLSLLLVASHGNEPSPGQPDQKTLQGALVCQDWQDGVDLGAEHCFAGSDLPGDADLTGLVAFLFACYGAGTPQLNNFAHEDQKTTPAEAESEPIAFNPFVASLPKEMLRRGALAIVGHVDRSWTLSFSWPENPESEQTAASLADALQRLLRGERLGHALRPLGRRYTALAARLLDLQRRRNEKEVVSDKEFGLLWTAHLDARNFIILGDPAVYLLGRRQPQQSPRPEPLADAETDQETASSQKALSALSKTAEEEQGTEQDAAPSPVPTPDLKLFVRHKKTDRGTRLSFTAMLRQAEEGIRFEPERIELGIDDRRFFEEQFRSIENMPQRTEDNRFALETAIDGIGRKLFTHLLPPGLQRNLWQLHQTWRREPDVERTVLVISEEAWIPWQMLKLHDPRSPRAEEPFLGEAWGLTRWSWPLLDQLERHLHLPLAHPALVITSDSHLPYAEEERGALKELYQRFDRPAVAVPAKVQSIVEKMKRGFHDGWHFSGHGIQWGGSGDQWSIVLDDESLFNTDHLESVGEASLGHARPLVFLNACHSGDGAPSLGRMGGLASTFLRLGAGAFIGASWKTRDDVAAEFARLFYQHFLGGRTLGEAVRRARLDLRANERFRGDASWMTYTAFAHPLAVCATPLAAVLPGADQPRSLSTDSPREEAARTVEPKRGKASTTQKQWIGPIIGLILGLIVFGVLNLITVPSKVQLELWLSQIGFELIDEKPQQILSTSLSFDYLEVESFSQATFTPESVSFADQNDASWSDGEIVVTTKNQRAKLKVEALDEGSQPAAAEALGLLPRQTSLGGKKVQIRVDGGATSADLRWVFEPEAGVSVYLPRHFSLSPTNVITTIHPGNILEAPDFEASVHTDQNTMNISAKSGDPLSLTISVPAAPERLFYHRLLNHHLSIHGVELFHDGLGQDFVSSLRRAATLTYLGQQKPQTELEPEHFVGFSADEVWSLINLEVVLIQPEATKPKEAVLHVELVGETAHIKAKAGHLDPTVYRTSMAQELTDGHLSAGWLLSMLLFSALGALTSWLFQRGQTG